MPLLRGIQGCCHRLAGAPSSLLVALQSSRRSIQQAPLVTNRRRRPRVRSSSPSCSSSRRQLSSSSSSSTNSSDEEEHRRLGRIRDVLRRVQEGRLPLEQAARALAEADANANANANAAPAAAVGYDAVDGYAKIDFAREARTGLPEVIYGEGKTPEQLLAIFQSMGQRRQRQQQKSSQQRTGPGAVIASRVSPEKFAALKELLLLAAAAEPGAAGTTPEALACGGGTLEYLPTPRLVVLRDNDKGGKPSPSLGTVSVLCAGTADLAVAEEAAVVAELCGAEVQRIYDVGIAGIHRLFAAMGTVRRSHACVAVAGMDGALPTVVAGLVQAPVIAVPTSVGYGVGANGLAPLMTMLNACAPGVAVVNIDNGLGAAAMAIKILRGRLREP